MKVVSVLSGGLDSTILTYKLVNEYGKENVLALTYQYGQKHSIEVEKSKITCSKLEIPHHILDISFLGDVIKNVSALSNSGIVKTPTIQEVLGHPQPPTYVPFRNLILSSIALSVAESNNCEKVYLGLQNTDLYSYWDTSFEFVEALNNISLLNRQHDIKICTPFVNLTKKEEIKMGLELHVPFEDTWTCYNPVKVIENDTESYAGCSTCPSCSERIMNFLKAGVKDPIKYAKPIDWDSLINQQSKI